MASRLVRPVIGGPYEGRDETTVYGASGIVFGDITMPVTISLRSVNIGRRDVLANLYFWEGATFDPTQPLGWEVSVNQNVIFKIQGTESHKTIGVQFASWPFLWPAVSSVVITSLNTGNNNTQERGCYFVGTKLEPLTDAGGRDRAVGESLEWYPKEKIPPNTGLNPFIKAVYGVTRI